MFDVSGESLGDSGRAASARGCQTHLSGSGQVDTPSRTDVRITVEVELEYRTGVRERWSPMSAALVDEFSFEGYGVPMARTQRRGVRPVAVPAPSTPARRLAPCEHGVPIVPSAGPSWRLTDRGIAVVLALFVALFVAGVAVLVGSFLAVSDAPQSDVGTAAGVVRVLDR
jgi:hypothetical protein